MFEKISVGQRIPQYATGDTMIRLNYTGITWVMVVGFPGITQEEVQEVRFGSFKAAAQDFNGILFFFAAFGQIPWCDASYEPRLNPEITEYPLYDMAGDDGAPLTVLAVDTLTGEIKAIRMIGLGSNISNIMSVVCNKALEEPFDEQEYRSLVQKVYREYPTTAAMLKRVRPESLFVVAK